VIPFTPFVPGVAADPPDVPADIPPVPANPGIAVAPADFIIHLVEDVNDPDLAGTLGIAELQAAGMAAFDDVEIDGVFQPAPDAIHFIPSLGKLVLGANALAALEAGELTVNYTVENLQVGDLNPAVYFNPADRPENNPPNPAGNSPGQRNQHIMYEFNYRTSVQVNSLARNVVTDRLYADLRSLIQFTHTSVAMMPSRREIEELYLDRYPNITEEELNRLTNDRLADEDAVLRTALWDRMNNMLRLIDDHALNITQEHTHLGSRMRRVEMFEIRLEQDESNVTRLKSENEDVDMARTLVMINAKETAYENALRIIANNMQLSLIRFI
jgi:flagellin-like hook-associated protein FlgL